MHKRIIAGLAVFGALLVALLAGPVSTLPTGADTQRVLIATGPDGQEFWQDRPVRNAPISVANASECHGPQWVGLCGKIKIEGSNTIWLVHEWGIFDNRGQGGYFRPGTASTDVWADTDGFVTRPGWCTDIRMWAPDTGWYFVGTVGQGNFQIHDSLDWKYVWTWDC
jgi:hypothetical protein